MECPTCKSPDPKRHPAVQFEGEVQPCADPFHLWLKSAIAIDDYKEKFFLTELAKAGFTTTVENGFTSNTRLIYIAFPPARLEEVAKTVKRINTAFAASRN